jgi:hypothetical protein
MRKFCADLTPEAVEEGACCVCGQLNRAADLSPLESIGDYVGILTKGGYTRTQRSASGTPVLDLEGPMVLSGVNTVCSECCDSVKRGVRPKLALANHLWLGEVPECLKDLTLAKQTLISHVRFNHCVVRISNGHAKMVANVIAFEHPAMKFYEKLPIGKNELDDVLGVFFTRIAPPSDDDLKRMPVIVCCDKVKTALEWLKFNHKNYADLDLDYTALQTYPLQDVPVQVVYV